MFGGNFQTWKLHSAQDYFMFFAYILAGVMVFWLIAKHMNKQRNHEKAVEKVSARLKKICGKPGEVLKNATLNLPEGKMTFDAVLMDKRGVYLVRTYGWGIKIYGTPDGAMWRREDAKRKEEFENPLLELKKGADTENLKNMLYKKTKLEDTFGVNMLAVADGRPETLSLKQVIEHHVDFVFDVTTRKYTTLLNKEQEKKEIQEGLIKACDVIDLIIEILRGSKNREQVKKCLVDGVTEGIRFKGKSSEKAAQKLHFSEKQAAAILDMRLYKLIGLEIEALQADYAETMKNIAIYEDILNNYDSMAEVIMKELDQIKKEYGTKRRTVIENAEEVVYEEKKMEEMEVTFLMDRFGYMRTIDKSAYERNKEAANAENKYVFNCMNTDKICIFTDNGKMHSIKVADIPLVRFRDKGTPADNLSNYDSAQERMLYVAPLASVKENTLLFVTAASMCKLVSGAEFDVAKRTIVSTKLAEEDSLIFVGSADEMEQVVFQSEGGYFLRFQKQDISAMKKTSIGVRGMKLAEGDKLDHAYLLESRQEYTITYHDKPYVLNRIKLSKRDSKGTKPRI